MHILCASDSEKDSVPVLTVRMIKPGRGHNIDAEAAIPRWFDDSRVSSTAFPVSAGAMRLKGQSITGKLWMISIPLDPCAFQNFLASPDENHLEMELTKTVRLSWRFTPKPVGPRSAVHIFAVTLEESPLEMVVTSKEDGHIFEQPQVPAMDVRLHHSV